MRYGVQGSAVGDRTVEMVSGADTTQTTLSGLTPSTTYSIEVAAVTGVDGIGVYSSPISEETDGEHLLICGVYAGIHREGDSNQRPQESWKVWLE